MMTKRAPDPERWTDRSGGSSVEAVLGAALRRAQAATLPSEALYLRLEAGLERGTASAPAIHRWRVAVVTLAALLALGTSVGAARGPLRAWAEREGLVAPRLAPPAPVVEPTRRPRTVVDQLAQEPDPIEAPLSLAEALAARTTREATMPSRPPGPMTRAAPIGPPIEVPGAEEARLLEGAFRSLRSEARPAAALAALDDYDRRFPSGLLGHEARLARVEALLSLGERGQALALLDRLAATGDALPRSARVARGELRAEAGRCLEAGRDFDVVLAASSDDDAGGRALYGRASCALRAGDEATAAAALSRYVDEHPAAPNATAAREALAGLAARAASP
jgi:hypothetical protein